MHIKKETHQWHPQSHVTSLNSLILTVEFPLDSGCAVAEATAILFNNCFNCSSLASFPVWLGRAFFSLQETPCYKNSNKG